MAKKREIYPIFQPINKQTAIAVSYKKPAAVSAKYSGCLHGRSFKDYKEREKIDIQVVKNIKQMKLKCHDCKRLGFYTNERCHLCKQPKKEQSQYVESYNKLSPHFKKQPFTQAHNSKRINSRTSDYVHCPYCGCSLRSKRLIKHRSICPTRGTGGKRHVKWIHIQ